MASYDKREKMALNDNFQTIKFAPDHYWNCKRSDATCLVGQSLNTKVTVWRV